MIKLNKQVETLENILEKLEEQVEKIREKQDAIEETAYERDRV